MDVVIKKYIKLAGKKSSDGEYACKLAREAYFRTDVMGKCTCNGSADKLGLPKAELLELKETVKHFQSIWALMSLRSYGRNARPRSVKAAKGSDPQTNS